MWLQVVRGVMRTCEPMGADFWFCKSRKKTGGRKHEKERRICRIEPISHNQNYTQQSPHPAESTLLPG